MGSAFKLSGIIVGLLTVYGDPSLSVAEHSLTNPSFLWASLRTAVFVWLIFSLILSDLKATRTYLDVGRNLIQVDLLDVQSLAPFACRVLRSALTWVIFSLIFSLYWIEDRASIGNPVMFVAVLMMAAGAFIVPLVAVHANILLAKHSELDRLRE